MTAPNELSMATLLAEDGLPVGAGLPEEMRRGRRLATAQKQLEQATVEPGELDQNSAAPGPGPADSGPIAGPVAATGCAFEVELHIKRDPTSWTEEERRRLLAFIAAALELGEGQRVVIQRNLPARSK